MSPARRVVSKEPTTRRTIIAALLSGYERPYVVTLHLDGRADLVRLRYGEPSGRGS